MAQATPLMVVSLAISSGALIVAAANLYVLRRLHLRLKRRRAMRQIEPNSAPGGLVFVYFDADDNEHGRISMSAADVEGDMSGARYAWLNEQAELHAQEVVHRGGFVGVFDGDSGEMKAALGMVTRIH